MSQALQTAIDELVGQIAVKEAEIAPLKIAVNTLCRTIGTDEMYPDVGTTLRTTPSSPTVRALTWSPSQFFGRQLASCVGDIMEARVNAGLDKACSVDDIFTALKEGGFRFEGGGNEGNSKRAIKISLTKNTAQFVKLPNELFSLKKWFGGRATKKIASRGEGNGHGMAAGDESFDENESGGDSAGEGLSATGELPLLENGAEPDESDVLR
jgi:hypothetical protein